MNADTDMTDDDLREIALTAYALDELDADGRAAVEARLDDEPALRERVAEIRAEADAVGAAFANEPMPAAVDPPTARSPWVRRGLALAACLGLAGGTAWVLDRGVREPSATADATIAPVHVAGGVAPVAETPGTVELFAREAEETSLLSRERALAAAKEPGEWDAEVRFPDGRGGVVANDNSSGVDLTLSKPGTESWAYGVDELGLATPQSANEPDAALQQFLGDVEGLGRRRTVGQQKIAWTSVESSDAETHVYFDRRPNETYAPLVDNPFRSPVDAPLSTFSIDVDTASYANVRRMLEAGHLPLRQHV